MITKSSSRQFRSGFTLIELLVVIAIMIVLVSLTTAAVMRFRATGPQLATRTNLQNIKKQLDSQWKVVKDKAFEEAFPPGIPLGVPLSDPRARPTYIQFKLVQAFPVSFSEVMTPTTPLGAYSSYTKYLISLGVTSANASTIATPDIQQSICLLMILEKGPGEKTITQESLGSTNTKLLTVGMKTAYGCVDAFGTPLLFTRALTFTNRQGTIVPLNPPVLAIISAGQDGRYGMDPNTWTLTTQADTNDNLDTTAP